MRRGWLGEKTGQGFYKRVKERRRRSEILALDLATMEYRPRQKARFASLEIGPHYRRHARAPARSARACPRCRADEGSAGDKAQQFLWSAISQICVYAARRIPEISDSLADVDRAMRWGFAWELGPFEMWDTLGVQAMAARLTQEERRSSAARGQASRLRAKLLLRIRAWRTFPSSTPTRAHSPSCASPTASSSSNRSRINPRKSPRIPAPASSIWATAFSAANFTPR